MSAFTGEIVAIAIGFAGLVFMLAWIYFFSREFIREIRQDFRAWRRGEKRVAPRGTWGRVYTRKNPDPGENGSYNGPMEPAKTEPQAFIHARKFIAAENRWVDLGQIASPDSTTVMEE